MRDTRDSLRVGEIYKDLRSTYPRLSPEEFDTLFNSSLNLPYGEAVFSEKRVSPASRDKLSEIFLRRSSGTAVEYITGFAEFMGLTFEIADGVFIPKNSTETLVEKLLENSSAGMLMLDVGCGSGNIAVAAAKFGNLSVTACDINPAAVSLARKNAQKLRADIKALRSDLFSEIKGKFDIIASNPPYIKEGAPLDKAVLSQPEESLFSGADGLDCIRKIAARSRAYLKKGGRLFLEIGHCQSAPVKETLFINGWKNIKFYKDLSGITRVAEASC